jgi:membrane associated rhomboid family serine protease
MIPLRDSHPSNHTPIVTFILIAVNSLIFLYQVSLGEFEMNEFIHTYAIVPAKLQYGSMVTSMFLHGGWMHLIGNMWFLWIFGDNVEDILGPFKYLLFYLACGVLAAMAQLPFNAGSQIPILGASGAIAGVMGAYLVKFRHSQITTLIPLGFIFLTRDIPATFMIGYWIVLQVISGVLDLGRAMDTGGVAFFAHVGGFVAGLVLIQLVHSNNRYFNRQQYRW